VELIRSYKDGFSLTYQKARIALSASRVQKDCVLKFKEGQLHFGLAQASMLMGNRETLRIDSMRQLLEVCSICLLSFVPVASGGEVSISIHSLYSCIGACKNFFYNGT